MIYCGYCGEFIREEPLYWKVLNSSIIGYYYCNAECSLKDYEKKKNNVLWSLSVTSSNLERSS